MGRAVEIYLGRAISRVPVAVVFTEVVADKLATISHYSDYTLQCTHVCNTNLDRLKADCPTSRHLILAQLLRAPESYLPLITHSLVRLVLAKFECSRLPNRFRAALFFEHSV